MTQVLPPQGITLALLEASEKQFYGLESQTPRILFSLSYISIGFLLL